MWLRSVRYHSLQRTMATVPSTSIPVFQDVTSFRQWRQAAREQNKSVGFVATMGALHQGHMSLVHRSLAENDLTVLSIFVNPAQFAPHEDLATYPRTLPQDLEILTAQVVASRKPSALFLPSVQEMYPSGIEQMVASQKGTFVEVKGYGEQMEGKSRPVFFRGVATVVTKLFNVIEPTNTYFGQKDIQQALILKRLCRDLLLSHPSPDHLHIVPTARDPADKLALSSRNAYLTSQGREVAPTLFRALEAAKAAWEGGLTKDACIQEAVRVVESTKTTGTKLSLDYIELNNSNTFDVVPDSSSISSPNLPPIILSGALWVDKTRLIDNIILGDACKILS